MGPPLDERGNGKVARPSTGGRSRFNGAALRRAQKPAQSQQLEHVVVGASMGPRTGERGNAAEDIYPNVEYQGLQWGHAP